MPSKPLLRLAAALALSSCVAPEKPVVPPTEVPGSFSRTGETLLPDQWWRSFDDPALNRLVDQAMAGNLSLRTVWDRLRQARAAASQAAAPLFPEAGGTGRATRTREVRTRTSSSGSSQTVAQTTESGSVALVENTPGGTSQSRRSVTYSNQFSLGLDASYELDLWGRVRSARDAAVFDARATAEEVHTAALSLSASVASTWYQLVEQYAQIDLLQAQADLNNKAVQLITTRFRQGQVGAADVLQQRQLEESRRGALRLAEAQAAVLEHQLAILLGRPPQTRVANRVASLRYPPALPATGVPAELVQRRPDIRQSYYQVLSADRRVASAIVDLFPRLSLTASTDTSSARVRDLFDNWLATIGANLTAPIFEGGRRVAEVRRTRAILSERLNAYGQTILESLGEVEDALVREQKQRQFLASLERQLELSRAALTRTRQSYLQGANDYLRVLDALVTQQDLERSQLEARRQLIQYRIDLCRALGGSWEMRSPPLTLLK